MSLVPRHSLLDLDTFFDRPWSPFLGANSNLSSFSPRVDIKENNNTYEVTAELPGVKIEDINVSLQNGVLTIEAETKQEKEEQDNKIIRQERHYGKYVRSFDLGPAVQESDISANFRDGILTLCAPKTEQSTPTSRKITIKE